LSLRYQLWESNVNEFNTAYALGGRGVTHICLGTHACSSCFKTDPQRPEAAIFGHLLETKFIIILTQITNKMQLFYSNDSFIDKNETNMTKSPHIGWSCDSIATVTSKTTTYTPFCVITRPHYTVTTPPPPSRSYTFTMFPFSLELLCEVLVIGGGGVEGLCVRSS
jgi:hypothetical protein